jgi:signal transduction histidine kinase
LALLRIEQALKVVSSHQRRVLAGNDIPVALGELLGSLAGILTREAFQVEINRRLGALLRVAGIELQIVQHETETIGSEQTTLNPDRLSVLFVDGECDLLFTFGLAQLSERSRQSICDTAITILTDYLRTLSLSSPVAPQRLRRDNREKEGWRNDLKPSISETLRDDAISTSIIEANPTVYTPPYNAAGFAHRLRNLLTAIMSGSSQLAAAYRSRLDAGEQLLIGTIERASLLQEELIKRYLMAYEPLRLTLRSLDLGVALCSATERHEREYGCQTEITSVGDRIEITSDAETLRQIVVEILKNAHEASGGEKVTLCWNVTDQHAVVAIKNRGQIIDADFDGIFSQPFYTTKAGHAGLGLNIARRYAGYLGGVIHGLSRDGYTTVTIYLPFTPNKNNSLYNKEKESQCPPY